MIEKKTILQDKGFKIGLILIPISLFIHLLLSSKNESPSNPFSMEEGIYYLNYLIAIIYFLATAGPRLFKKWFKSPEYNYQKFIVALILFSISCFTINITFPIFSVFSTWVNVYLVIIHLSLLLLCFNDFLPKSVKIINTFALGVSSVMVLYFTVYLLPLFFIGVFASFLFGLSLHLLVPVIMLVSIIVFFAKLAKSKQEKTAFYIGILLPIFVLVIYCIKWDTTTKLIQKSHASIVTRPDNTLPTWVLLSQEIDIDFFSDRILKGDIVYETSAFSSMDSFGRSNSFGEIKEHDPLVVLGSEIMGSINIDRDDRLKILESSFDLRHHSKRKLWSGKHLTTSSVNSYIQVIPEYRLAYTEKIIRIKNNYSRSWNRQEEALYTFHLPEGSVATSLSLWIDGKEEKSRLSTKSKADSAYTTIVGVERRDPSIMHWQEGNTITVYVFPCTQEEERMFKIGITTPLKLENDKLILQNVYFKGPSTSKALETTVIEFKSKQSDNYKVPNHFKETVTNKYEYNGKYVPYWELELPALPLAKNAFSFNGHSYKMEEAKDLYINKTIDNYYFDINKEWTKKEFDELWLQTRNKNVFVFYDGLHRLNDENKNAYFDLLKGINFSLFPLNEIENAANSLLITKSAAISPNMEDLSESEFVSKLKSYLKERKDRINLFSMSSDLSPYLKTLKEFQVFNFEKGDLELLLQLLSDGEFVEDKMDENTVSLDLSNAVIKRDTGNSISKAPDHLLRLFAYNKIMQECGRSYLINEDYVENSLIDIANEAYIVSPVSSLIVLESNKDYERFDITENKNSLQNASTNSAGAVPEPHEWLLIILLGSTLIFLYYKRKKDLQVN